MVKFCFRKTFGMNKVHVCASSADCCTSSRCYCSQLSTGPFIQRAGLSPVPTDAVVLPSVHRMSTPLGRVDQRRWVSWRRANGSPAAASACPAHVGCPPRGGFRGPCSAAPAEIPPAPPPAGSDKYKTTHSALTPLAVACAHPQRGTPAAAVPWPGARTCLHGTMGGVRASPGPYL